MTRPLFSALLLAASASLAGEMSAPPPPAPSKAQPAFDKLKALAGTWTGPAGDKNDKSGKKNVATVVYALTGGGSAVVETLFPGTPHEMMTVYHLDGDDLVLTHYCAARNQPRMKARPLAGNVLDFEFAGGANIGPETPHMHSAHLVFEGPDKLVAEWTNVAGGKAGHVARFEITRKK